MRWLVLLLVAACYRDAPAPPANRAVHSGPRASGDILAYLPGDSDLVVVLDMPQIRATATWQRYEPAITQLAKLTAVCGVDIATIQRVAFGLRYGGQGVMIVRGLSREPFMKCALDPKATTRQITIVGDVMTAVDRDSGATAVMRFVDDTTLAVLYQAGGTAAALDAIVRAGSPLRRSPAFLDMFGRVDTGAPLWFAAAGTSKFFDVFTRMGYPLKGAGGSIRVGDGFELVARCRFEAPSQAQTFAASLRAQVGAVQAFVDSIDVAEDDVEVNVTVKITEAQVERLVAMMGLAKQLGGP
jgi:hypothetical protein